MTDDSTPARIAQRGRDELHARLRAAIAGQAAAGGLALGDEQLQRLVADAAARAGGALWRRCLVEGAVAELGISLDEAVAHPAVEQARELAGAPPVPEGALRLAAVHVRGIESLSAGERDLELRIWSDGLDVLKRSSGALIGRLPWSEVREVELARTRRGIAGRRAPELHLVTGSGRASFQLPTVTDEQLRRHLEPLLARRRADRA